MPISLNPSILSLVVRDHSFTTVDASLAFYPALRLLDISHNTISSLPPR